MNQSATEMSFKFLCAYFVHRRSSWCLVCRLYLNKGRIVRSRQSPLRFFFNKETQSEIFRRSSGSDKLIRSHTICVDKRIDPSCFHLESHFQKESPSLSLADFFFFSINRKREFFQISDFQLSIGKV